MKDTVLYIHGFASGFDPESSKVKAIEKHFSVIGLTLDYSLPRHELMSELTNFLLEHDVDLIIGTSMGGHMALEIANRFGVPAVAINPAIQPHNTLRAGVHQNYHTDKKFVLTKPVVDTYKDVTTTAPAIIIVNMDDDVINPNLTIDKYSQHYTITKLATGGHRCVNIDEAMDTVVNFFNRIHGSLGHAEL